MMIARPPCSAPRDGVGGPTAGGADAPGPFHSNRREVRHPAKGRVQQVRVARTAGAPHPVRRFHFRGFAGGI